MPVSDFDAVALYRAMDARRIELGLSWRDVAQELWQQSVELNRRREDHPISVSTLTGILKRGDTSCQHALFVLRWLGRTPESFLSPAQADIAEAALPTAGPDRRLRWDLASLSEALNAQRSERGVTWSQLAAELRCSAHQLSGLKTVRYAIGMTLAMRIVQWLDRPAAAFIYPANW